MGTLGGAAAADRPEPGSVAIAGAGIGGLAAALSLHAAGWHDVRVYEAAAELREIGVGLNLPPHAVRELTELGLGPALAAVGVPTDELAYYDRQGRRIWAEPRGEAAGYRWPQYSIHRGRLQRLLVHAVRQRLGPAALALGARVAEPRPIAGGVAFSVGGAVSASGSSSAREDGEPAATSGHAGLLIVADGIRSRLRDDLQGRATPLASNGWRMYRGVTRGGPFLSGRSMVICGDDHQRIVVYPIGEGLLNWLMVMPPEAAPEGGGLELGRWNLAVPPAEVARYLRDWRFDWLDMQALVAEADEAYVYPMADIDPLPRWVFGRAALLGDAAHAMYPFGSNGASQAILDARVLACELAREPSVDAALAAYETGRRPQVSEVQLANRRQAGTVMARVSELVRGQDHAAAARELEAVEERYKRLAGFDVATVNEGSRWTVTAASGA